MLHGTVTDVINFLSSQKERKMNLNMDILDTEIFHCFVIPVFFLTLNMTLK